jgi:putative ABC transport system permease protein
MSDLRQIVRGLLRAPGFTLAVVVTLALGIGATAAIFSVVYAVLLKPLPYPAPERLFVLGPGAQTGEVFHYVRDRIDAFENVAARRGTTGWNLVAGAHVEHVIGVPVSRGYFDVLGVPPLVGRGFSAAEDQPRGPGAVVLSEAVWRRVLGGRPEAIGEVIQLGGIPHTIVGIMPSRFRAIPEAALWTPLQVSSRSTDSNYTVIARLRPQVTEARAAAELDALRTSMAGDLPGVSAERANALAWVSYQQWLGRSNRNELELLLGAVSFLLLIASVNVASLQLVRGVAKRREMATRAALGGGRVRLTQYILIESVVISLCGAALGLIVAHWGLQALLASVPQRLLGTDAIGLEWQVLAVILAVSVAAGIVSGLAPAFSAARLNVRAALWEGGRHSAGRPTMWLRRIFTGVEVALAVVLLVGAGLLIRSFINLRSVPLGFDPADTIVGKMSLQGSTSQAPGDMPAFLEQTLLRLRATPGIVAAAVSNNVPVESGVNLGLRAPANGIVLRNSAVDWRYVTAEYFDVFRIPIRAGRIFNQGDHGKSAPVAVVNEAFGRTYFGRPNVVGEIIEISPADVPRQIVGVVADVKGRSGAGWTQGLNALAAPAPPTVHVPIAQVPDSQLRLVHSFFPISWAVRTRAPSPQASQSIEQVVRSAAPHLPFVRFETMDDVIARDVEMQTFLMTLFAVFAGAAMVLAAIGMYGLMAYSVSQRTQEVGIRMALGATAQRVLGLFLGDGLSIVLFGLATGVVASAYLTRLLAALMFNVAPNDPLTFVAVGGLLVTVAAIAILLPSLQAARTDPARTMRAE